MPHNHSNATPGCADCGVIRTDSGYVVTAYCARCRTIANIDRAFEPAPTEPETRVPLKDLRLILEAFRKGKPVVMTVAHQDAYERLRDKAGLER